MCAIDGGNIANAASRRQIYTERLAARQAMADRFARALDQLGWSRVGVFTAGVALAILVFVFRRAGPLWLVLPAAVFLVLLYWQDQVAQRLRRAQRAVRFYARGLERLEERWQGTGEAGLRFLDEAHPYALDLDLFGTGSLFERLCTARTHLGENTLADWLRGPAPRDEVLARQTAVRELVPRLDLREDLALLGTDMPGGVDFSALVAWGLAPRVLTSKPVRLLAAGLGTLNFITLFGWLFLDFTSLPFAAALLLSGLIMLGLRARVRAVLGPVEAAAEGIALLAGLLARLENEPFAALRLRALQSALQAEGRLPSQQIAELARRVEWHAARHNQLFAPVAVLLLWNTQFAFAFEAWRARSGPALPHWLAAIGTIEALAALAAYTFENPADPFPEISAGTAEFNGVDLGHPLLPIERCVCNDVALTSPLRLLLVSGSNMSGKSTLLRTVGINAVLALAGGPVRARRLTLTPLAVGATLRVQDSLQAGRSRFFAEITRVRQLMELTHGSVPVLFLLDELFHGTNSHDRLIGARAVIGRLLDAGAVGLVTTHDLALTQIACELSPRAQNVHFEDDFVNGSMSFDYRMRPGVVPRSNALALMRSVGLDVDASPERK
jgi:hypothetical protein